MSSAIKTPAFQAKAGNIQNEDGSSIYSGGEWSFKNASAVTGFHVASDGKVGVGTTSPTRNLHIKQDQAAYTWARIDNQSSSASAYSGLMLAGFGNTWGLAIGSSAANGNALSFLLDAGGGNSEKMRIDANGNLRIGTTSHLYSVGEKFSLLAPDANTDAIAAWRPTRAVGQHIFQNNSGQLAGYINWTGTTTTYFTTSDYRLKEDVQPITNALYRIASLKPCTYKWKADGTDSEGFIAHELAEVCPLAVAGEKDEVHEDGSIKPQAIDPSKLVALLTAAIQELSAKNEALEARLAALESK